MDQPCKLASLLTFCGPVGRFLVLSDGSAVSCLLCLSLPVALLIHNFVWQSYGNSCSSHIPASTRNQTYKVPKLPHLLM